MTRICFNSRAILHGCIADIDSLRFVVVANEFLLQHGIQENDLCKVLVLHKMNFCGIISCENTFKDALSGLSNFWQLKVL